MSVSAPRETGTRNPATKFIQWKAGEEQGFFSYYDKSIEKKEDRNIKVDLSDGFFILDEDLFSITGFINKSKTGIVSNEVRTINDELFVKGYAPEGKGASILLKGPYSVLKEVVKESKDYNYTKCIYILFKGELCHLSISGATYSKWLSDVQPNTNRSRCLIHHSKTELKKNEAVKYNVASFSVGREATPEEWDKMLEVDSTIVQPYLTQYLAKGGAAPAQPAHEDSGQIDTSKWREQITPAGTKLGDMLIDAIRDLSEMLVQEGKSETPLYDYVGQALYDYQMAAKTWDQKTDSSGKLISEYSLAELEGLLGTKVPIAHKASLIIQAAIDAKQSTEAADVEVLGEEDDIPF